MTFARESLGDGVTHHGAHIALVLVPVLLMLGLALGADIRAWWRRSGSTSGAPRRRSLRVATELSVGAGLVHALVAPAHFHEAGVYGTFFVASAVAQIGWAAVVTARPVRWLLVVAAAANSAIIILWLVTRTIGIPLGPEAGEVEAFGLLDVVAAALEAGVVIACVCALRQRPEPSTAGRLLVADPAVVPTGSS